MKKCYTDESPSKVVIVPKPPKSHTSDSTSIPTPVKSVVNKDVLEDVKDEKSESSKTGEIK
ncbi:MAG: hypothetical protein IJ205_02820 [Bacteroidales bacterium]|nr:hypothetical protein [Bacteroidales bacterium]